MKVTTKTRNKNLRESGIITLNQYVDKYGYLHIKKAPGYWPLAHKVLWEEAGRKVPHGCLLRFINGDKLDVRLDNLRIIGNSGEIEKENEVSSLKEKITELEKRITEQDEEIESLKTLLSESSKDV
jgi:hypothetical protein